MTHSGGPPSASSHIFPAFAASCRMSGPLTVKAVHRDSGVEQTFSIDRPFAIIGRIKPASIILSDPSVSRCHAYLQIVGGVPYCCDLGSRTGLVWPDGSRNRGWMKSNQALRIGSFDVLVWGDPAVGLDPDVEDTCALAKSAALTAALEVYFTGNGTHGGGWHDIEGPLTLIGRHPYCDLRFLDDAVGYFNCAILTTPDGVWCVDAFSRKGTLVNGRTTRLARLQAGDLIELGKVKLLLRLGDHGEGKLGLHTGNPPLLPQGIPEKYQELVPLIPAAPSQLHEMLNQFQQYFQTLTGMVTTLQKENAAMHAEYLQQMRDLSRILKNVLAANGSVSAPAPTSGIPATATNRAHSAQDRPTPTVSGAEEAKVLAEAHGWFLDRLTKLGQKPQG